MQCHGDGLSSVFVYFPMWWCHILLWPATTIALLGNPPPHRADSIHPHRWGTSSVMGQTRWAAYMPLDHIWPFFLGPGLCEPIVTVSANTFQRNISQFDFKKLNLAFAENILNAVICEITFVNDQSLMSGYLQLHCWWLPAIVIKTGIIDIAFRINLRWHLSNINVIERSYKQFKKIKIKKFSKHCLLVTLPVPKDSSWAKL